MRFLGVLFIVLFTVSCQSIEEAEKPEKFIKEVKMEHILYDVAVMNAARGYNVQKLKKNDVSPNTYIFEKYGIDSLQYAQNTAYYSVNIDDYKEMYLRVEKRLNALSDSLNIILEAQKKVEDSLRKIENLERRKRDSIRRVNGDSLFKLVDKLSPLNTLKVKEVLRDSI